MLATRSGYIRSIDESRLLEAARNAGAVLRIDRYIGQFVMAGTPVLVASPASRVTESMRRLSGRI